MEYKKESSHQQDLQLLRLPLHANWLLETKTALNLWICTCCAEIKVCTSALAAISRVWQSTAWLWSEGATGLGPKLQETTRFQKCFSDFSAHFFVAPLQPLPSTAYKAARCSFPPPRACRCRRRKHFRVRQSVLDTKILTNEQIQSFIYLHILLVRCSIYIICIYIVSFGTLISTTLISKLLFSTRWNVDFVSMPS